MLNLLLQSVLSASFPYFTQNNISSPFCLSLPIPGSLIWWKFCSALCSRLGPPHPGFLSLNLACLPFDVPSRLFLPFSFSLRSPCIFISLSRSGPCFCTVGGKCLKMEWSCSSVERWRIWGRGDFCRGWEFGVLAALGLLSHACCAYH